MTMCVTTRYTGVEEVPWLPVSGFARRRLPGRFYLAEALRSWLQSARGKVLSLISRHCEAWSKAKFSRALRPGRHPLRELIHISALSVRRQVPYSDWPVP